ncbi:hypothetical protein [Streptomyces sp. NPDC002205]|uniref:hypothetical protein n=1 Tax=Streptomyces sp. NPDC002205 TaxID=3154411 RepID=UPI0033281CAA
MLSSGSTVRPADGAPFSAGGGGLLVCADHSGVDLDQPIDVTGRIGLGLDLEVGWDHSRIATRKTELVQGAGGDVVGVVGQRGHREEGPLCDRDQQTVVGVVLDASLATLVCAPVAAAALGGEVERVQVADRTFRRARPSSAASVLGEGGSHLTKRS